MIYYPIFQFTNRSEFIQEDFFPPECSKRGQREKESMITAQNADQSITRNASFFKKLPSNISLNSVPIDEKTEQSSAITDEATESIELMETVDPVTPSEVAQLNPWQRIKPPTLPQIGIPGTICYLRNA